MDGHTAVGDRLSVDPCMVFKGKGGLQSGIMAGNPAGRCFGLPYVVGPRSGTGQGRRSPGLYQENGFYQICRDSSGFAVVMLTRAANPLAVFLGIMGLKAAAYLQPFVHRRLHPDKEGEGEAFVLQDPPEWNGHPDGTDGAENMEKKEVKL